MDFSTITHLWPFLLAFSRLFFSCTNTYLSFKTHPSLLGSLLRSPVLGLFFLMCPHDILGVSFPPHTWPYVATLFVGLFSQGHVIQPCQKKKRKISYWNLNLLRGIITDTYDDSVKERLWESECMFRTVLECLYSLLLYLPESTSFRPQFLLLKKTIRHPLSLDKHWQKVIRIRDPSPTKQCRKIIYSASKIPIEISLVW